MFHWAPPEVNGLGVMTSTSSFTRSSQVWMFLGLPLRTAKTTIELLTKPLVGPDAQFAVDDAGLDQAVDVRGQREGQHVGVEAGLDRAALVAGRAVGLLEVDALAGGRRLEVRDDLLVDLARGRVADQGEGGVAPAPACGIAARAVVIAAPGGDGEAHGDEHEGGEKGFLSVT